MNLPLRNKCQDSNRPTGVDGSSGFGTPTLRGIWDTFPLLLSGSAGLEVVGAEPTFGPHAGLEWLLHARCRARSRRRATRCPSSISTSAPRDALRAMLTAPLAVVGTVTRRQRSGSTYAVSWPT